MKPLPSLAAAALALAAVPGAALTLVPAPGTAPAAAPVEAGGAKLAAQAGAAVPYQCSGIGSEERAAAESVPHTLRLIFAQADGHYLGGVATRLTDATGTELASVTCDGPWLLVDLPDGRYRVSASLGGTTVERDLTIVGGRRQQLVIRF